MIKFVVAGLWLCIATIGAVFYAFQTSSTTATADPPPALLGGLDYVGTPVVSVPVLTRDGIVGYFLTKLVYTVEPEKLAKLSVPAEVLLSDELYTYLFANPTIDFTQVKTLDLDAFRSGVREAINKRVGDELVHDVMVEQVDFLSKEEIRDNTIRRRATPDPGGASEEKPSH
jgi:hypothetical protein